MLTIVQRGKMLRFRLLMVFGAIAILCSGVTAPAAVVNPPPGLSVGDTYRLVFVSSTTRDATSSDVTDYDAHVQAAADAGDPAFAGITWKAIGSTSTVDAITHIGVSAPTYLVNETSVAGGSLYLFDGSIAVPINVSEGGSLTDGSPAAPDWRLQQLFVFWDVWLVTAVLVIMTIIGFFFQIIKSVIKSLNLLRQRLR